jgi:hypothetical protein
VEEAEGGAVGGEEGYCACWGDYGFGFMFAGVGITIRGVGGVRDGSGSGNAGRSGGLVGG